MLLLRVTDDRGVVTQHIAESFPFRIGRSVQADLRIEAAGVWDTHAVIVPGENSRFLIRSEGESLLLRNGELVRSAQLASGDEFSIGAAWVLISLAPAAQKRLAMAEAVVWLLLLSVVALQTAVFTLAR